MSGSSISGEIRKKVEKMPFGAFFDYSTLGIESSKVLSAAQSLSRLSRQGVIRRLSKGKYFKPKPSKFGNIRPQESAIIDSLTIRDNKRIGYITGLTVYNTMGLTSQISNTLIIATSNPLPPKQIEGYKVKYIRRNRSAFSTKDIPLFQLLDALSDIKEIPDASPDEAVKILKDQIEKLSSSDKDRLVMLSLSYNAGTRALLGALMEQYFPKVDTTKLKESMNRLSTFSLNISSSILPHKRSWSIV